MLNFMYGAVYMVHNGLRLREAEWSSVEEGCAAVRNFLREASGRRAREREGRKKRKKAHTAAKEWAEALAVR